MLIKQLSVFLENREGSLTAALEVLAKNGIDIVALSLADTSEYGMLRMIVSDPELGKEKLKEAGFACSLTDVVAIRVPHNIGSLAGVMKRIVPAVNVEYMYAFANGKDASAVIKVTDSEALLPVLQRENIEVWTAEEAYKMNQII